jgi:predicted metal-dependent hydrolase
MEENSSVPLNFSCDDPLPAHAAAGLSLFNRGEYFEAHEELETAWRAESGAIRELYRGILQVAVAYYHLTRRNYLGAVKMFKRCKPWLEPFPDTCRGIKLGQFKRDFLTVEAEVKRLGPERIGWINPQILKPIEYDKENIDPKETTIEEI